MEWVFLFVLLVVLCATFYWMGQLSKQEEQTQNDLDDLSMVVRNAKQDHAKIDDMSYNERINFLRRKKS